MPSFSDPWVANQARQLVFRMLASWHRRGSSLLQIGLADLPGPDVFWDAGFDVSALSDDPALLEKNRAQYEPRVDFFLGAPDHTPFDDAAFDYVALVHSLAGCSAEEQEHRVAEAFRLARLGVLVVEWNRFAPSSCAFPEAKKGLNGLRLFMLGKKHTRLITARYTLNCSSKLCGRVQKLLPGANPCKSIGPLPLGALMCFKYDKQGFAPAPVAPVPAFATVAE